MFLCLMNVEYVLSTFCLINEDSCLFLSKIYRLLKRIECINNTRTSFFMSFCRFCILSTFIPSSLFIRYTTNLRSKTRGRSMIDEQQCVSNIIQRKITLLWSVSFGLPVIFYNDGISSDIISNHLG